MSYKVQMEPGLMSLWRGHGMHVPQFILKALCVGTQPLQEWWVMQVVPNLGELLQASGGGSEVPPSIQGSMKEAATQQAGKEIKDSRSFHRNQGEAIGLCVAFTVYVPRIWSWPPAVASSGGEHLPLPGAERTEQPWPLHQLPLLF